MRPACEFRFGEERLEKLERGVLVRIALHVEVDERTQLFRASQNWAQLRAEVCDRVGWISRVHLGVKRGDFDRKVHYREQLRVAPNLIGPTSGLAREVIQKLPTPPSVFVSFLLTDNGFAEQI